MPLDLPTEDAGLSFTGVYVAQPAPAEDEWAYGPIATAEFDGRVMAVAWSDGDEAEELRPSADHDVFELPVSAVLSDLPDGVGLVIDPHAPLPRVIEAQDKERVARLGRLFAEGVPFVLHEISDGEVNGLLTDLQTVAPRFELGRLWCVGYEVVGGPAVPLVVAERFAFDAGSCAVQALERGGNDGVRIEVCLLEQFPERERAWVEALEPLSVTHSR